MDSGSARDILTSVYPSGLPELVIRAILRPVLSAVDYLHSRAGIIHRSIAAHHILLGLCQATDAPLVKLSGRRNLRPNRLCNKEKYLEGTKDTYLLQANFRYSWIRYSEV